MHNGHKDAADVSNARKPIDTDREAPKTSDEASFRRRKVPCSMKFQSALGSRRVGSIKTMGRPWMRLCVFNDDLGRRALAGRRLAPGARYWPDGCGLGLDLARPCWGRPSPKCLEFRGSGPRTGASRWPLGGTRRDRRRVTPWCRVGVPVALGGPPRGVLVPNRRCLCDRVGPSRGLSMVNAEQLLTSPAENNSQRSVRRVPASP